MNEQPVIQQQKSGPNVWTYVIIAMVVTAVIFTIAISGCMLTGALFVGGSSADDIKTPYTHFEKQMLQEGEAAKLYKAVYDSIRAQPGNKHLSRQEIDRELIRHLGANVSQTKPEDMFRKVFRMFRGYDDDEFYDLREACQKPGGYEVFAIAAYPGVEPMTATGVEIFAGLIEAAIETEHKTRVGK